MIQQARHRSIGFANARLTTSTSTDASVFAVGLSVCINSMLQLPQDFMRNEKKI